MTPPSHGDVVPDHRVPGVAAPGDKDARLMAATRTLPTPEAARR